jgi:hypothetical protein
MPARVNGPRIVLHRWVKGDTDPRLRAITSDASAHVEGIEMRGSWALVLAPLLAVGFLTVASGPANAFGSEVLGCGVDGGWTAHFCEGGGSTEFGELYSITFAAHNLSGTYSYAWTIQKNTYTSITTPCSSTTTYNCIESGCTATSSTCVVGARQGGLSAQVFAATLRLTQSGQSTTIDASAQIDGLDSGCRTC